MDRRSFLIVSLAGVAVLAFASPTTATTPQIAGAENHANSNANLHIAVLQRLFAPELITTTIVNSSLDIDYSRFASLDLSATKILALGVNANNIARKEYGESFLRLPTSKRDSVIDGLMKHPKESRKTYIAIRNLLFADPRYLLNPEGNAWKQLGYQSFDYTTDDNWQVRQR